MEKHLMTKTAGKQAAHTLSILTTVLNSLGGGTRLCTTYTWLDPVLHLKWKCPCYTTDRRMENYSFSISWWVIFWSSINAARCVFAVVFTEDSWHYLQAKERHKCRRELLIWISHIDLLNQNAHNFTWYLTPRGSWSLPLVA